MNPTDHQATQLTPAEFAERMRDAFEGADIEANHLTADRLMCDLLESLGYGAGVDLFRKAHKWYA